MAFGERGGDAGAESVSCVANVASRRLRSLGPASSSWSRTCLRSQIRGPLQALVSEVDVVL